MKEMAAAGNRGRTSGGFARITGILRLCSGLIAILLVIISAAGKGDSASWEERLEQARRKYNKNTVNVFAKGHGKYQRGKINVCFYPAEQQPYIIINIRESLQITDEAEMEAVLEVIAESEGYDADEYGTIPFMKAQWIAHNIAHSMANGNENQKKLVETITGESISSIAGRSKELDLSPYTSMPEREILLYQILELALFGNGH